MYAEYLPSALNIHADWESRNANHNSEWKLDFSVFHKILTHMGQPTPDLFASRLCHQLLRYIEWKPDPGSIATDAFLHPRDREYSFAFPPFSLISRVLRKILQEKIDHLIIVTPTWQTQPWYAQLLKMSVQPPFLPLQIKNLLIDLQDKNHPLIEKGSLRLAVWKVSGKVCKCKEFQTMLQNESAQSRWTSWCNERQVNLFPAPMNYIINFLSEKFDEGLQYRTLNCFSCAVSSYHVHIDGGNIEWIY